MCNVQVYTGIFFLGVFQLKNIMISIKVNMHSYHTVYTCIFFFYAMLCNFCNTLGFFQTL